MNEHIIRHEDDKVARLQSSLTRFRNGLFNTGNSDQHLFLITKTDGSQRTVRANYVEFDVVNKEAEVFKSTGTVGGTRWTNVEEVEELE